MIVEYNGQTYTVRGVFLYDEAHIGLYQDGDIIYRPDAPGLYVYQNLASEHSGHQNLHPIWYYDIITNIQDYLLAELYVDSNQSDPNVDKHLKRPVAAELLKNILDTKFGTGVLTGEIDLNNICRNGRYVIVVNQASQISNLPSIINVDYISNIGEYRVNSIIGLDVWHGKEFVDPDPSDNVNTKEYSNDYYRQTVFAQCGDVFIIATRSGERSLSQNLNINVTYDENLRGLKLSDETQQSHIIHTCNDITWSDWVYLHSYPHKILAGYYTNRTEHLIESFDHAIHRHVLGVRATNYNIENADIVIDSQSIQVGRLTIPLHYIPMSVTGYMHITAIQVTIQKEASGIMEVYNITLPIPHNITGQYMRTFYNGTPYYIRYTKPMDSDLHTILEINSEFLRNVEHESVIDIVLLT